MTAGGRVHSTALPRGRNGHNLIEAGGTYDLSMWSAQAAQSGQNDPTPVSIPAQTIQLTAVLFRDGTFEGDVGTASRAAACNPGEKIMLGKLLPILDQALSSDSGNPAAVLERLRADVSSLTSDVDPTVAEELAGKFPSLSNETAKDLKYIIELCSNDVKTDLLKRLKAIKSGEHEQTTAEPFHAFLTRIRDGLKDWHDRL
jgi:hypothetical protein